MHECTVARLRTLRVALGAACLCAATSFRTASIGSAIRSGLGSASAPPRPDVLATVDPDGPNRSTDCVAGVIGAVENGLAGEDSALLSGFFTTVAASAFALAAAAATACGGGAFCASTAYRSSSSRRFCVPFAPAAGGEYAAFTGAENDGSARGRGLACA